MADISIVREDETITRNKHFFIMFFFPVNSV